MDAREMCTTFRLQGLSFNLHVAVDKHFSPQTKEHCVHAMTVISADLGPVSLPASYDWQAGMIKSSVFWLSLVLIQTRAVSVGV